MESAMWALKRGESEPKKKKPAPKKKAKPKAKVKKPEGPASRFDREDVV